MPNSEIEYKITKPSLFISDFVESFWMVANLSDKEKEVVVLPDGRIDISFSFYGTNILRTRLTGLSTEPMKVMFPANTVIFAVSLNLLAIEYLLNKSVSNLVNGATQFPEDFLDIQPDDLHDFDFFCEKVTNKINERLMTKIDDRKRKLFKILYFSNGSLSVKEIAEEVFWSTRQINRYFNETFGIALKTYCKILRFRASFIHIKDGKLFPEQNFADQAHFIKEVKKLSGVSPKVLFKNNNDRFIHFTTLPQK